MKHEKPLTTAGQTYNISCGENGKLVQGNRVKISQTDYVKENETEPYLMIAEMQTWGYKYLTPG